MRNKQWLFRFIAMGVFIATAKITQDLMKAIIFTTVILLINQWLTIMYRLKKRKGLKNSSLDVIDSMEGIQFEKYLYELFLALGYKVQLTAESGDYGADLILNDGDSCIVVQAKRHKSNVGITAVQEVLGAKAYYEADYAWVVTNSSFTNSAVELADRAGVSLYSRLELSKLMASAGLDKPSESEVKRSFNDQKPLNTQQCPMCFSPMVLRKGKHGVFYGCSTFPKCKGTKESK